MSNSNSRCKEYDTFHHLTSRIAHRVYFLAEDERNDLMGMIRRSSLFTGIQLLAWCIMSNHFHLLVYLPVRPASISEEELLRRYEILKGPSRCAAMREQLSNWRAEGDVGAGKALAWLERQRKRMYDVGAFMKMIKQWFSEEYNRRQSHVGTLWESAYYDRVVECTGSEIAKCAAYIHLNPIRAALCAGFAEYSWSSLSALAKGDAMALEGMRFVYGIPAATPQELITSHTELLNHLLEREKRRRAEGIARKRLAGYDVPHDPLTTDAMVAQAMAHIELVQKAGVALKENESGYRKCNVKRAIAEDCILAIIAEEPYVQVEDLAKRVKLPKSTVYRYLRAMESRCEIEKPSRHAPWSILKFSN